MRRIIEIHEPESIGIAPIDLGDERDYLVTAIGNGDNASVVLGVEQVTLLADRMSAMVDELERRGLVAIDDGNAGEVALVPPAKAAFHAETMLIGWDEEVDQLVIEAWSVSADDGAGDSAHARGDGYEADITDDDPIGPDVVRIRLEPVMAQHFIRSSLAVLFADRSLCPLCGEPLGPTRHRCGPIEDAARGD